MFWSLLLTIRSEKTRLSNGRVAYLLRFTGTPHHHPTSRSKRFLRIVSMFRPIGRTRSFGASFPFRRATLSLTMIVHRALRLADRETHFGEFVSHRILGS